MSCISSFLMKMDLSPHQNGCIQQDQWLQNLMRIYEGISCFKSEKY